MNDSQPSLYVCVVQNCIELSMRKRSQPRSQTRARSTVSGVLHSPGFNAKQTVQNGRTLLNESQRLVDSSNGYQPKPDRSARRLNPKKLLLTKWTATQPQNKEKHFIVTKLIGPDELGTPIDFIEIEATYSKRAFTIPWRELNDETKWRQGWK